MSAYLRILRPLNCLFIGFCVLAGAWWGNPAFAFDSRLLAAFLSAMLIGAAGYVINDVFDLPIDRINRPDRPLPSGRISPAAARRYAFLLFGIGIAAALFTHHARAIAVATGNAILLHLYAKRFKNSYLFGNLIVAALALTSFLFGGMVAGSPRGGVTLGVCAMLLTGIREWIKDLEDVEGDREAGSRTVAVVSGRGISLGLCWAFLALFGYFVAVAAGFATMTTLALTAAVVVPNAILLAVSVRGDRTFLSSYSTFLKLDMLLALMLVILLQR